MLFSGGLVSPTDWGVLCHTSDFCPSLVRVWSMRTSVDSGWTFRPTVATVNDPDNPTQKQHGSKASTSRP